MNTKLNLAVLNKKREEITESEMIAVKGGAKNIAVIEKACECATLWVIAMVADVENPVPPICDCASVWVVFGFMLGPS